MKQKLLQFKEEFIKRLEDISTIDSLKDLTHEFLGRKEGKLTKILRGLAVLPPALKPEIGRLANDIKTFISKEIDQKTNDIEKESIKNIVYDEWIDNSLPGKKIEIGHIHPITQFIEQVYDVFGRMGFDIAEGPEIETEFYNFTALNIPKDHPAREMQDTFWLDNGYVLRTQTSSVQIRYMENNRPPIRIIAPGKTFRKDSDATHSPMFHQFEGLMVDKNISISNLRAVLISALSELLHYDLDIRFRTSYFPFVEPGLEVDVTCVMCEGKGRIGNERCKICKGSRWLEMGGAGSVHPNVLKNVNINPEEYTGFAFGFGIERPLMIKHRIDDMRHFFENDLRFLQQF